MRIYRRCGQWFSLLLVLSLAGATPKAAADPVFNVIDYGAHKDGSAPSTDAIHLAIQAAKSAGGGTVYIPPGNYVCGPIELISNLVLHVDAGATLHFPAAKLPFTQGRQQGVECLTPIPLIGGENLENVTITGRGTLATDNAQWLDLMGRPQPKSGSDPGSAFGPAWNHFLDLLQQKTPQPREEYLKVAPFLRPAFIRLMESKNVLIDGIQVVGSPFWTIHLLYSQNIVVRDVTLQTFPGVFTGGIYVDSSRDVRISDCDLDNGDDAIVLKAGKDADGLRVNRPTENVTIANCIIHRGSAAIVLGSETSGGIRNIVANNIVCQGTQMGINIKSERGRGGGVENVRFDNFTIDDVGKAISISEFYTMQGEKNAAQEPVSKRTPVFRDIALSHITISHARGVTDYSWNPISVSGNKGEQPVTIDIQGLPEMPISNLRLSDIIASGKAGLRASDTNGLELHDVQMNAESGPAFLVRNSSQLELDDVSTRVPLPDAPVVRIEHSAGAIIRSSQALPATGVFLSVPVGELNSLTLQNNVLLNAAHPTEESAAGFP